MLKLIKYLFGKDYKLNFLFLYSLGENYGKDRIGDHIRYLKQLAEKKKNLLSGPINKDTRGIALINAVDEKEAKLLAEQDPGVKNKVLKLEILKIDVMFDNI